ncbi:hypothetical protein [Clostridium sporogenes]|nr:hypothetical protein [Clostridium sporogenes]
MILVLLIIAIILCIIACIFCMYLEYKKWNLLKQRENKIDVQLSKLNARSKKSSNNLISYHAVAGDIAQARTDKKEK